MKNPSFRYLTKSKLLHLNRCKNLFFQNLNTKSEGKTKISDINFGLENEKIKNLAKSNFENFTAIPKFPDIQESAEETKRAMEARATIFHPVYIYDYFIGSPEVLIPNPSGTYTALDIAPSVNLKRDFELGIAYHKFIAEKIGLPITDWKVLKINPNYLFRGELDLKEFFQTVNLGSKLDKFTEQIQGLINFASRVRSGEANQDQIPENPFVSECKNYKSCLYPETCFQIPEDSDIFTLRESAKQAQDYYKKNIYYLRDIPESEELTEKQIIQIQVAKNHLDHINKKGIQSFLKRISYPVYYLDFETINPQIPIYLYSKPYQYIPFLYSLHVWKSPEDTVENFYYIQTDSRDPRKNILDKLASEIVEPGTILCFNDFFERRCIQESILVYPEYRDWYEGIKHQFLDIAIPFKSLDFYSDDQKGSASLKDVLPALTGASHSHLDIQNGYSANMEYLKFVRNFSGPENQNQELFAQLVEYCQMDSYALHLIHKKLMEITDERSQ
jgi:hypothetical protein